MEAADGNAKWLGIFRTLQKNLRDGAYPSGVPVPSEAMLARKFDVSRITVVRAMEELRKRGLVWRKRGGSSSRASRASSASRLRSCRRRSA